MRSRVWLWLAAGIAVPAFAVPTERDAALAVVLYSNTQTTGGGYNAGAQAPADSNRRVFDDVAIPLARLGGRRHVSIDALRVGIRREAGAPATDVYVYWSTLTSRPVAPDTELRSPGVGVCGFTLPATASAGTVVLTCGSAVAAPARALGNPVEEGPGVTRRLDAFSVVPQMWAVPLDFDVVPGAGSFAVGVQFTNPDPRNAWATADGPDQGGDLFWRYDGAHTAQPTREARLDFGGTPRASFYLEVMGITRRIVEGDLDDSGDADLLFRQLWDGKSKAWFLQEGTRVSPEMLLPSPLWGAGDSAWKIVGAGGVFDPNGARTDLLLSTGGAPPADMGQVYWAYMPFFGPIEFPNTVSPVVDLANYPWHRVAATGDFDGNGWADLLLEATRPGEAHDLILILRDTWNFAQPIRVAYPLPGEPASFNWRVAAARDFDNDGLRDLLFYNQDSGRLVVWFLDQDFARLRGAFTNPPAVGANNWTVVASGDYGVGPGGVPNTQDVVWRNRDSGRLVIWFLDGDPTTPGRTAGILMTPDSQNNLDIVVVGPK